jgi:hypothetical protein
MFEFANDVFSKKSLPRCLIATLLRGNLSCAKQLGWWVGHRKCAGLSHRTALLEPLLLFSERDLVSSDEVRCCFRRCGRGASRPR